MKKLSGSSLVKVTKEAVHCDVEDEIVILSIRCEYEVDMEAREKDLMQLLGELLDKKLIEVEESF